MSKYRIVPYKLGSKSAKLLADEMTLLAGYKVWSGRPKPKRKNILWGSSSFETTTLQPTAAINIAKNKLSTFQKLKEAGVSIPEFTTDKAEAERWVNAGVKVLARQMLNASSGKGIVICDKLPVVDAPLYVKYVPKKKEFRVHVVNGVAVDMQQKRRRRETESNDMIRNLDNGWVFTRNDIVEPEGLRDLGIKAVQALGLLFGAVDIIYNERRNALYVLEVNTAPGLCPSTAKSYAKAFIDMA